MNTIGEGFHGGMSAKGQTIAGRPGTMPGVDDTKTPHHRQIAAELCAEFTPHDKAALARMSVDDLTAQCEARAALFRYVYALLEPAKADGLDSANNPKLSAVAGMWNLINELLVNAENAKLLANENAVSGDSESAG